MLNERWKGCVDRIMSKKEMHFELLKAIKNSDIDELSFTIGKCAIDKILDENLIKDVPIIGSVVSFAKLGLQIHDYLFIKKIASFLFGLSEVTFDKRKEFIEKLENSEKDRIKVGEKLLFILDQFSPYALKYQKEIKSLKNTQK